MGCEPSSDTELGGAVGCGGKGDGWGRGKGGNYTQSVEIFPQCVE